MLSLFLINLQAFKKQFCIAKFLRTSFFYKFFSAKFLRTPTLKSICERLLLKQKFEGIVHCCCITKQCFDALLHTFGYWIILEEWLRNVTSNCNVIEKETLAKLFYCEFGEIFKNTVFNSTPLVAASDDSLIFLFGMNCFRMIQVIASLLEVCLALSFWERLTFSESSRSYQKTIF